ncbi:NUDIX domain-containing protein [Streptomyces sp. NPDC051662]|uniref:NUDIX hydrolase n=1 Tax=Streptomyces sp. NPDC051662 TaxID=3154750 RepID=UPI0034301541
MPLPRSHIRATAEAYLARHPHERESLPGLLSLLDAADVPADRATLSGHVTCSAAVIDRDQRVLHIGYKATGLLLDPGGHVEGDRTLLAAALRGVCGETDLRPGDLCLTPQFFGAPIDIDVHDIDANPSKGEGAHQHFDFRFAFYLVPEQRPQLALQYEEVAGARWLEFADVRSPTLRAKLLDARDQGLDGRPEPVNASALIHNGHGRYLLHLRDQREGTLASVGSCVRLVQIVIVFADQKVVDLTVETATRVVQVTSLRRVAPSATRRAMPSVGSLGSATLPSSEGLDQRSPVPFTARLYRQTQENLSTTYTIRRLDEASSGLHRRHMEHSS